MSIKQNLIYIAGYGRSGSTLLEKLLQCQPSIYACGEMANFFKIYGSSSIFCSCGKKIEKCEFWSSVLQELFRNGFSAQNFSYYAKIQKKREAHWSHGGSFFPDKYQKRYANLMQPFLDAVSHQFNLNNITLIDSSKTAYSRIYRPIAISQLGKYRVSIIHLVRDCRGVYWSVKKGLNRWLERGEKERVFMPLERAVIGWIYSNKAAGRLKDYFGKNNYCMIKYEDFVETPVQILKHLETFLELDLNESIRIVQKTKNRNETHMPTTHQLSGNRMRFNSNLTIIPDYAWKEKMSSRTNAFIKTFTMPLLKKYGYL